MTRVLRLAWAITAPVAVEDGLVAGRYALVARPWGEHRASIVFLTCAGRKGLELPAVRRLIGALGGAGFLAVAPELPGLTVGEVTPATLEAAVEVATVVSGGGRVALFGASTGAGLAVVAARDERLAGRVSVVAAVAPFADLRTALLRATTTETPELLSTAVPRSLRALGDDVSVERLLANRDPRRFEELYDALPREVRDTIEALSPVAAAPALRMPLLIAADPADPFFPLSEAVALASAGRAAELTVTPALHHVRPRLRRGFTSLVRFVDRLLELAAAPQVETVRA